MKSRVHLFDVEDKEVFDGADGRKHRTVECADPADGLTVDDLQHILRNSKLLLAPPPSQRPVTVLHNQPEKDQAKAMQVLRKLLGEKMRGEFNSSQSKKLIETKRIIIYDIRS